MELFGQMVFKQLVHGQSDRQTNGPTLLIPKVAIETH